MSAQTHGVAQPPMSLEIKDLYMDGHGGKVVSHRIFNGLSNEIR